MEPTLITEYITPELLILIPVLCMIGIAFKKASWMDDKHIPVALGVVGIVLAAIYVCSTSNFTSFQAVLHGLFTAVVQGVLCAAGAVYANQIKKQESTVG